MAESRLKSGATTLSKWLLACLLAAGGGAIVLAGYYAFVVGPSERPLLLGLSSVRLGMVLVFLALGIFSVYWARRPSQLLRRIEDIPSSALFPASLACSFFLALTIFILLFPDYRLGAWQYIHAAIRPVLIWLLSVSLLGTVFASFLLRQRGDSHFHDSLAIALLFLYVAGRLLHAFAIKGVAVSGDTDSYLKVPLDSSLLTPELWLGARPFTLPMLMLVFQHNFWPVAWVQALLSISSWGFLAWTINRQFRQRGLGLFAQLATLLHSISHLVLIWDFGMLSESLTLSLMALLVALFIRYAQLLSSPRLLALLAAGFFWAGTRDVNAFVLLLAGLVLGVLALWKRQKRTYLWATFGFLLIFVFSLYSAFASNRDFLPNYNALTFRTLKEEGAIEFFADRGMPLFDEDLDISQPSFFQWVDEYGQRTLLSYLIDRLPYSLAQPFVEDEFPVLDNFLWRKPTNYIALSPILSQESINLHLWTGLWLLAGLLAAFESFSWLRKEPSAYGYVSLFVLVLAVPHAFLAWHADGFETYRHVVGASVQFQLGLLMTLLYISSRYLRAGWRPNIRSLFA